MTATPCVRLSYVVKGLDNFCQSPKMTYMPEHDDFLGRVQTRLRDLEREDSALAAQEEGVRRKRGELQEQINRLRASAGVYRDLMGAQEVEHVGPGLFEDIPKGTIAEMASALIRRQGGPLHTSQITQYLEQIGKFQRAKPDQSGRGNYGTVFKTLTRDRRFAKVGRGEWQLTEMVPATNGHEPQPEQSQTDAQG